MAANNWRATIDNNWGTAGNWSLLAVPTAGDGNTATFDALSPNCTVNTSNRVCNSITFNGYLNTLTMTFNITVSGAIIFQATQSARIAGAGTLSINETATITNNGGTWPNPFTFSGTSKTVTLADAMIVTGLVTLNFGTAGTINGFSITASTSLLGSNVTTSGTTIINMTGTGSLSTTGTGSFGFAGLTIKSTASITLGAALNIRGGLLFTVEASAVVVTTGNSLNIAASCTMNTSVMGTTTNAWNNINQSASGSVLTLTSDLYGTGTLQSGAATTSQWNGAFNINWSGTVTLGTSWLGTATLVLSGTTSFSGGICALNMTWASGTITQGSFTYRTNTWTISSGVTVTSSGTITFNSSPSIAINATGITFNAIACTLSTGSPTYSGSNGFTVGTYSCATSQTHTWKAGNTYAMTTAVSCLATAAGPCNWVSSTPTSSYTMTLTSGITQSNVYLNVTDADSSLGATGWTVLGTLLRTVNWNVMPTQPITLTYAS